MESISSIAGGGFFFGNQGAEKITGYSAAEVTGRRCADNILNHIDADGNLLCRGGCPLLKAIRAGQEIEAKVYPLHKDGHRFPTLTHVAPIRDEKGKIVAGIEIFRDITIEEDFRHLQEKFNTLIKKYVSATTFEEVMTQAQAGTAVSSCMRDLTVLFLDIVGFTTFSETKSPEEVVTMLNEVFGVCEVITCKCHGDIDKFIGDCVMAVFIDANDAVDAACQILYGALVRMNVLRQERGQEPVHIRIGINSGHVIQGDVGSAERKDLTVIGDVVNAASRIQSTNRDRHDCHIRGDLWAFACGSRRPVCLLTECLCQRQEEIRSHFSIPPSGKGRIILMH